MIASLRASQLFPWFTPLSSLKGVGPATLNALERLLSRARGKEGKVLSIRDLVFHIPYDLVDRSHITTIAEAQLGTYVTLKVHIDKLVLPSRKRFKSPSRILVSDSSGSLMLTYFNMREETLKSLLPQGQERLICGTIEHYDEVKNINHPDIVVPLYKSSELLRIHPVYALVAGMYQRTLDRLITQALSRLQELPEWANPELVSEHGWPSTLSALREMHCPKTVDDLSLDGKPRLRLAYDEALANQLALLLLRKKEQSVASPLIPINQALHKQFLESLPFALTKGQLDVIEAIFTDLSSLLRMLRLLQGDVGSGKTLVALAAMIQVAHAGGQSALMAPTELLARQHVATLQPLAKAMGFECVLLTGKLATSERKLAQSAIESGKAHIVIGTHALFQTDTKFANLMLVVMDEQHRFGVEQRMKLSAKGTAPHILQMSATPIPRSLTMTAYGDMDISQLTEKPQGRQAIETRTISLDRTDEVIDAVDRALKKGQKLYWICPLIEQDDKESAQADMAAVEERARLLTQRFGECVAMVHGRMKPTEREEIMARFAFGDVQLLVATTVIEVGVNVPDATIMIIEHAERFGLAQLHQLRGRVGRGDAASSCILLYHKFISAQSKERLLTIRNSNDGFFIAEEDLRLRGAGDVLGTKQTGLPDFHFIDLLHHQQYLAIARQDARHLLLKDPELTSERGKATRLLLALFGYDEEVSMLRAV